MQKKNFSLNGLGIVTDIYLNLQINAAANPAAPASAAPATASERPIHKMILVAEKFQDFH